MTLNELTTQLDAKRTANGWTAKCPAHDDRTPSLSIGEGRNGGIVLCCHAGCTPEAICAAIGIRTADLMPPDTPLRTPARTAPSRPLKSFTTARDAATQCNPAGATLAAVYEYPLDGEPFAAVARYEFTDGKTFRQFHHTPAGWTIGAPADKWPLFREADLPPAGTIYVCEGEKAALAAVAIGLPATTSAGGSKAASRTDWQPLASRDVVIIPDNDAPGEKYAAEVAEILASLTPPATVRLVRLPGLDTAGDIADYVQARQNQAPEAIRREIEQLCTNTQTTTDPDPWDKPIGFDAPVELPEFPAEVLPEPFKSFVLDVARSKQVPEALPGAATLAAVALAAAKRFRVYIGQSHDEPLNIYSLTLMEPGSRKSDTFRACLAPVENYEIEQFQAVKPEIAKAQERREIQGSRFVEIRKRAGRCDDPQERHRLTLEAEEIAVSMAEIPHAPRLLASDVTPEHLTSLLCANGGRMAVADAEGGLIFEIMAGRYSKNGGCNIEIFLKGHAGDAVRVDRTGRPPEYARSGALTCILTAQPEILRNMASKEQMRGRGLLARFLYTMPGGQIGSRDYGNTPMQPQLVEAYAARLRELLHIPPLDPDNPEAHRRINLDGDALEIWRQYHDRIEHAQAPDGELSHMRDFASKLPGAVARLAAILHLMQHGATPPADIAPETTAAAWALGMFFLEHTKAAFAEMGAGGDMGLARRVYGWICRHRPRRFTLGELFNDLRRGSGLDRSEALLPAMEILEDRNIIRREPPPPASRPGRKSFGSYEIHPEIVSGGIL